MQDGDEAGWLAEILMKAIGEDTGSTQRDTNGVQEHPFDFERARDILKFNVPHARAVQVKVESTVGLGWVDPNVHKSLDPLCKFGIADLTEQVTFDLWEIGNGYVEVVRERNSLDGAIVGLHYVDAALVDIVIGDDGDPNNFWYEMIGPDGQPLVFRKFGGEDPFKGLKDTASSASGTDGVGSVSADGSEPVEGDDEVDTEDDGEDEDEDPNDDGELSELIHFRLPARKERHYGMPRWLAGVPAMELDHCMTQFGFDFFLNRCVPEVLFVISGATVDTQTWAAIEAKFKQGVGLANQRKTMALNVPQEGATVEVFPLSGQTDSGALVSEETSTKNTLDILSIHGVPPLLAGFQIPGKMGAANEMTNAMMAYQVLEIAPVQKLISRQLARTLGDPKLGVKGLTPESFTGESQAVVAADQADADAEAAEADAKAEQAAQAGSAAGGPVKKAFPPAKGKSGAASKPPKKPKPPLSDDPLEAELGMPAPKPKDRRGNGFVTILEEIDLGQAETVSKMRMSVAEARTKGRDLSAGPAERGSDIGAGRGAGTSAGGK